MSQSLTHFRERPRAKTLETEASIAGSFVELMNNPYFKSHSVPEVEELEYIETNVMPDVLKNPDRVNELKEVVDLMLRAHNDGEAINHSLGDVKALIHDLFNGLFQSGDQSQVDMEKARSQSIFQSKIFNWLKSDYALTIEQMISEREESEGKPATSVPSILAIDPSLADRWHGRYGELLETYFIKENGRYYPNPYFTAIDWDEDGDILRAGIDELELKKAFLAMDIDSLKIKEGDQELYSRREGILLEDALDSFVSSMTYLRENYGQEESAKKFEYIMFKMHEFSPFTFWHSLVVAQYSVILSHINGVRDKEVLRQIYFTGLLHDVGKMALDRKVVNSMATDLGSRVKEREEMKKHAKLAREILNHIFGKGEVPLVEEAIIFHHEDWGKSTEEVRFPGDIPLERRGVEEGYYGRRGDAVKKGTPVGDLGSVYEEIFIRDELMEKLAAAEKSEDALKIAGIIESLEQASVRGIPPLAQILRLADVVEVVNKTRLSFRGYESRMRDLQNRMQDILSKMGTQFNPDFRNSAIIFSVTIYHYLSQFKDRFAQDKRVLRAEVS